MPSIQHFLTPKRETSENAIDLTLFKFEKSWIEFLCRRAETETFGNDDADMPLFHDHS